MKRTMIASLLAVCLLASASTCRENDSVEGCGCEGPGKEVNGATATVTMTSPFFLIHLDGLQRPVDPLGAWTFQVCSGRETLPQNLQQVGSKFKVSGSMKAACPEVRAPAEPFKITKIEILTDNEK